MDYALINNQTNIVENVIVLDEGSTWVTPQGYYIIDIDGLSVGIDWTYNPTTQEWTAPPLPPNPNDEGATPNVIG